MKKLGKQNKKRNISDLNPHQRQAAMKRFTMLQPHLEEGMSLSEVAQTANVSLRTAQRWLSRYHKLGIKGLARAQRSDKGQHKRANDVVKVIEGLALRKPRLSTAAIHRKITKRMLEQNKPPPSYSTVYSIVQALDPAMIMLAHEGAAAFRDQYELVYRHRAERPNAIWQADHTQLDILILDTNGKTVRPWLTTIIDDYSRAVAGYTVFLGAPSALQTSLALRQAIWRKADAAWPVCGIPDQLYVDHGSDFTSQHLEQVAADLRFQLIYSTVGRPQGRGKVERLFGTLNTELLSDLPGYLGTGKASPSAQLSFSDLDAIIGQYFVQVYNNRIHNEIGDTPKRIWLGEGWLARMPDSFEQLDLLLLMVAKSRKVRRDGIHFQGLRYMDPTLAAYVGESVTIRYDPRDITEIRVFYQHRFLCRAISPEHAGQTITLKELQTARSQYRRSLRNGINERLASVRDFLPRSSSPSPEAKKHLAEKRQPSAPKLYSYQEDKL